MFDTKPDFKPNQIALSTEAHPSTARADLNPNWNLYPNLNLLQIQIHRSFRFNAMRSKRKANKISTQSRCKLLKQQWHSQLK